MISAIISSSAFCLKLPLAPEAWLKASSKLKNGSESNRIWPLAWHRPICKSFGVPLRHTRLFHSCAVCLHVILSFSHHRRAPDMTSCADSLRRVADQHGAACPVASLCFATLRHYDSSRAYYDQPLIYPPTQYIQQQQLATVYVLDQMWTTLTQCATNDCIYLVANSNQLSAIYSSGYRTCFTNHSMPSCNPVPSFAEHPCSTINKASTFVRGHHCDVPARQGIVCQSILAVIRQWHTGSNMLSQHLCRLQKQQADHNLC